MTAPRGRLVGHLAPVHCLVPQSLRCYSHWLPLAILDGLRKLVLRIPRTAHHPDLPAVSGSHRSANIDNCTFPTDVDLPLAFPHLTHLSLGHVGISEEVLQGMIANSPEIEEMKLDTSFGHRKLCLISVLPRLKHLAVLVRSVTRQHEVELDELVNRKVK